MTTKEMDKEKEELFEHYHFTADSGQSPLRIDKFLSNRIEGVSRAKIQAAADEAYILVNNNPVKSNYKVKPLDEISVQMDYPRSELEITPEEIPLDIVFEDTHLMVINKPTGLVVHPGHGHYTGTLVNAIAFHLKDHTDFEENDPRMGLVHRIDKDTSGLLVVAKTEQAKSNLSKQFFDKTTQREYLALVWGCPKEKEGVIEGNIGRSVSDRLRFAVFSDEGYGKHAVTHYRVLEDLGYVSLVNCRLETGRTHQIRVHMEYIKHPLFNDERYGGHRILRGTTFTKYKQFVENCFNICPRQALHAKTLGFVHPSTGEKLFFEVPMPDDMAMMIEKWRNYIVNRADS